MAQALKRKPLENPDTIINGVRQFNPSKPHGTVYADGFCETRYVQEFNGQEVSYRGDGTPIGTGPIEVIPAADLARENAELKERLAVLEASLSTRVEGPKGAPRASKPA